jgi:hypothetical protein
MPCARFVLLFWKEVEAFVLIILLMLEVLDTPTYEVPPMAAYAGPLAFAEATMFMLFCPLWFEAVG